MIHGVVSYVNEQLLYFKLEENLILPGIYLAVNSPPETANLPKVGDILTIKNVHPHEDIALDSQIYTLCHNNKQKKFAVTANKGLNYLRMIQDYKLGGPDLFIVANMFESIKHTVPHEVDAYDLILRYVEEILLNAKCKVGGTEWCENNKLSRIRCKTISQCKHVQLMGANYDGFPFWSCGIHWSAKDELLIGYLFVHPKFGTICFKDSSYTVGCVITKSIADNLERILNKAVYIKKYCILTEIFQPNRKFNLEYLFMTYDSIEIVDKKRKRINSVDSAFKFRLKFVILSKSYVTVTQTRGYHFWLEIEEVESNILKNKRCFLCFPEKFLYNWPHLEVEYSYLLSFNDNLEKTSDIEYTRLNPKLPQFMIQAKNVVQISSRGQYFPQQMVLLNDLQTLEELLKETGLVSFQAVLRCRKFVVANSSRTNTMNIPPGFGTLGGKTYTLEFVVQDFTQDFPLYLNNWERLVMPIGLIPGAVINVRNVIIQKRKYFKSTALTTLEIVEYKPKKIFVTADLLTNDDWGVPQRFGVAKCIPTGALINGLVNSFFVRKLYLKRCCSECGFMSRVPGKFCETCSGEMEIICKFQFLISDRDGVSKVIVNNIEVVKVFMGLTDAEWSEWMSTFESSCYYFYKRYGKTVDLALTVAHLQFINITHRIIRNREKSFFLNIGVLCRKLDNSREFDKRKSLWFGLKAKSLE